MLFSRINSLLQGPAIVELENSIADADALGVGRFRAEHRQGQARFLPRHFGDQPERRRLSQNQKDAR